MQAERQLASSSLACLRGVIASTLGGVCAKCRRVVCLKLHLTSPLTLPLSLISLRR